MGLSNEKICQDFHAVVRELAQKSLSNDPSDRNAALFGAKVLKAVSKQLEWNANTSNHNFATYCLQFKSTIDEIV